MRMHGGQNVDTNTQPFDLSRESVAQLLGSLLSFLSCLLVLVTYFLFRPIRKKHPSGLVASMTLMGAVYYLLYIVQFIISDAVLPCTQVANLAQGFRIGQELYMMILALDLYFATKNPFAVRHWQVLFYHMVVVSLSILISVASSFVLEEDIAVGFCVFNAADGKHGSHNNSKVIAFYVTPIFLIYLYGITVFVMVSKRLHDSGMPDSWDAKKVYVQNVRVCLMIVIGYWSVAGGLFLIYSSQHSEIMEILARFYLGCRGILNLLVWTTVHSMSKALWMWKNKNWDEIMQSNRMHYALRRELMFYITKGIRKCTLLTTAERISTLKSNGVAVSTCSDRMGGGCGGNCNSLRKSSSPDVLHRHLKSKISSSAPSIFSQGITNQGGVCLQLNSSSERNQNGKIYFRDFCPYQFQELRELSGITVESYATSMMAVTDEISSDGKSGAFMYFSKDRKYILKTCTEVEQKILIDILPSYSNYLQENPGSYICRYLGCYELIIYQTSIRFIVLDSVLKYELMYPIHQRFDLKGSWVGRSDKSNIPGTEQICKYCGDHFIVGMTKAKCPMQDSNATCFGTVNHNDSSEDSENSYDRHELHQQERCGKDLDWRKIGDRCHLPIDDIRACELRHQLDSDSNFLTQLGLVDYSILLGLNLQVNRRNSNICKNSIIGQLDLRDSGIIGARPNSFSAASCSSSSTNHLINTTNNNVTTEAYCCPPSSGNLAGKYCVLARKSDDYDNTCSERGGNVNLIPDSNSSSVNNNHSSSSSSSNSSNSNSSKSSSTEARGGQMYRVDRSSNMDMTSLGGGCVAYVGIIDILTKWNYRKRMEHWMRKYLLFQNAQGMSCVNPMFYGQRLQDNVIAVLTKTTPVNTKLTGCSTDLELECPDDDLNHKFGKSFDEKFDPNDFTFARDEDVYIMEKSPMSL